MGLEIIGRRSKPITMDDRGVPGQAGDEIAVCEGLRAEMGRFNLGYMSGSSSHFC